MRLIERLLWYDQQVLWTEAGETAHYFDFNGDGNWSYFGASGGLVSKTVNHTYTIPGLYTARAEVTCGCYQGGMWWDVLTLSQNVQVTCSPGPTYAALYNAFQKRNNDIIAKYAMGVNGGTFVFAFAASIEGASVTEQNEFVAGAMAWTTSGVACNAYSCLAGIPLTTENPDVDVELVNDVAGFQTCGSNRWVGEGGLERDTIQLAKTGQWQGVICDDHRVETAYHEIGHSLGFAHITTNGPDLYFDPRQEGGPTRPISGHHLRILVEKYQ